MSNAQDWQETLHDLSRRRQHAHAMGGDERLAKHHGKGKLDARARIDHLLDTGTFRSSARSSAVRSLPTGSSPAPAASTAHR